MLIEQLQQDPKHCIQQLCSFFEEGHNFQFIPSITESTASFLSQYLISNLDINDLFYFCSVLNYLTRDKSNVFVFLSIDFFKILIDHFALCQFPDEIEKLIVLNCIHFSEVLLSEKQFQPMFINNKLLILSSIIESTFSIYKRLDFLIYYCKYYINEEESKRISLLLKGILMDDQKICQKVAWIIFHISHFSFLNSKYFTSFFTEIQFDGFEHDFGFLKPYLMFYLKQIQENPSNIDYFVSNFDVFTLFSIAFNIENSFISITCFKILKIIFHVSLDNLELKCVTDYVNSECYEMTFHFLENCSFEIVQSIISFFDVIIPFIELDKMEPFMQFLPRFSDFLSSECNLQPFAELLSHLVSKFRVDSDVFSLFLYLVEENEIIEIFTQILDTYDIEYPELTETCNFLSIEITKMNEC